MLLRTATLIALLGAVCALPLASIKKPKDETSDKWLLPKVVRPNHYDLKIKTYVETFDKPDATYQFDGEVTINVMVTEDNVANIVLHKSPEMTINSATITEVAEPPAAPTDLTMGPYVEETNMQTLTPAAPLMTGKTYDVTLKFTGVNANDMHGFYRSYYNNTEGNLRWLVTTQFESTDARRAFPCFDEPEFKAHYTISVQISKSLYEDGYHVLGNMPIETIDNTTSPDVVVYHFQKTAKVVSSYLIAFIVSDFSSTEHAEFDEGTKWFATWGQTGPIKEGQGNASQLSGPAALDVIKRLTGVPYGYPKLEQVGIPDFNAGAMENWGLVTYRERRIFYDPAKHPLSQLQALVATTTHELGHQWFGDLVTLHWWSDIWLNEGFATFFEYHASEEIKVEGLDTSTWKMVTQMVVDELQAGAFVTDAQPNSRALTTEVFTLGEISANFDDVAYSKGGSVLRMWMHWLGKENFYNALKSYLTENQEKVGTPELLLQAFANNVPASLKDVLKPAEDFKNWHVQAGYPVLQVTRDGNTSTLTQSRFLASVPEDNTMKPKWTIPITCTTSNKPDFTNTAPLPANIFKADQEEIKIVHGDEDWVIFNVQQTGFYRVNYDDDGWQRLSDALINDLTTIHEINRAQLIDDSFWLARTTNDEYSIDYAIPLNLTKYLEKETELVPWKSALNAFNFLNGKLAGNETVRAKFAEFILSRLDTVFGDLTLEPNEEKDSHTRRLLRPLVASLACSLGHEDCVAAAKDLFARTSDDKAIHPDVKGTVICTGVRESEDSQATWDDVWKQYGEVSDNSEQATYLSALGCSKNPDVIKGYLAKTLLPDSGIRIQDLSSVFSAVYNGNPENVAIAFDFLIANLESIAKTYGGGLDVLGGLVSGIANKLGTQDDLDKIIALRDTIAKSTILEVKNGLTGANKAVDIVTSNKAWLDVKQDGIADWLFSDENDTDGAAANAVAMLSLLLPTLLVLRNVFYSS